MIPKKRVMIETKQVRNLLGYSAILLAIFTATLYCIGTSHFYGLLSALNTDPYLIDRDFHQIIYYGALILINAVSPPFLYVFIVLMTLYVAITIGLLEYNWTYRRKKRLVWLRTQVRKLNIPQSNVLRFSINACTTLIVIILILAHFHSAGKQTGLDFINDIITKNTEDRGKITVKLDSSEVELFRVACGSTFCLGVDENKMQVHVFEKSAVLYTKIISK